MSEIPEGVILGEGQSWNTQHKYVQTKSSMCDKNLLLAAFAASGMESLTWLKEQSKDGVAVPPYATFRTWLPANRPAAVQKSSTPAPAIPTTPEGIKAQIAKLQEAYKESLNSKVDRLQGEIKKLEQELAAARKELDEITA